MFEKRLKEISRKMDPKTEGIYHILTHKKHRREIYFRNFKEAILFMKPKFNSFIKKIIYFLLKAGLLQPFLKKIKLSRKFGDVIFVGEKVGSFDLKKKEVLFFPLNENENNELIISKKFQKKVSEHGFAPQVYKINEEIPYSREELLEVFGGDNYIDIFRKIQKFYNFMSIERVPSKKYISNLRKELKKRGIKDNFLHNKLDNLSEKDIDLLITTLHGDFAKEQILVKNNDFLFIDWHPYKGFIIGDLVNFFRGENKLLGNKEFKKLLRLYPKIVQKNIKLYLILHEISSIIEKNGDYSLSKRRIKNLLTSSFSSSKPILLKKIPG